MRIKPLGVPENVAHPGRRNARLAPATLLRMELPLVALWAGLAWGLSAITTRVVDWFVMTDELLYERLAISVAQHGSPLPRVHDELIPNVSQLYPLLLAPFYRHGLVPDALHDAHTLNAWVMSSACFPAFLLARRVTRRRWAAYGVALLSVCVPWIVLSSFLLTEVVAYPAFLWAVLALQRTTAAPSRLNDVLLLLALALAIAARTQFVVLLVVVPLALAAHQLAFSAAGRGRLARAARETVGPHRVLAVAYAALVLLAVVLLAIGRLSDVLGTYSGTLAGNLLPNELYRAFAEHAARLALGLGLLPFVLAIAWLLANLVRPAAKELHAFACVGTITIAAILFEVTVFDLHFGGSDTVRDRYFFYVAPLVLVGFACVLSEGRWPRWSLPAPALIVVAGLVTGELPRFDKLNVDQPVAALHDSLLDAAGSVNSARVLLVLATAVLVALFLQGSVLLRRSHLAALLAVLTLAALPAETAYAFVRLFRVDGTAGRPLTVPQGVVFDWVDRRLGPDARVTIVPYPHLPGDYWASVGHWWDLEFWNRSVVEAAYRPGEYEWTPSTFPKLFLELDPRTGRASASPTPYVAQGEEETRFRISGTILTLTREVLLVEAQQPWRAEWLTFGLDVDGWTRPGVEARIRVFAYPEQHAPVTRTLRIAARPPPDVDRRGYELASNLDRVRAEAVQGDVPDREIEVCVPTGGYAEVRVAADDASQVYGEMRDPDSFGIARQAGVLLTQITLSGVIGDPCRPPESP